MDLPKDGASRQGGRNTSSSAYTIPTDLVDLPSRGKFYPQGHPLHAEETIEIRYMTTKEEDILLNQSFLEKGIILDKLIESLLVDQKIDVATLLIGDKNAIIINARKNAYGTKYEFKYTCIHCYEESEHTVDLADVSFSGQDDLKFTDNGTFLIDLPVSNITIEVGLLTAKDEIEINKKIKQKEKHGLAGQPTVERYRKIIKSVDGDTDIMAIANFVMNMPIKDSRRLAKTYVKHNPDVDFTFSAECSKCSKTTQGGVPLSANFFWLD
jgi:hypothetical protein